MGITQRLGTIPLAIQTDASNNVGIGAAPSGSYKLEVTGTGRFSSTLLVTTSLTVSSTTNAGLIAATNSTTGYAVLDLINNGASGKNYQIGVGGNAAASGYANNLYFDLVGVGNVMTLTSGRYVGIGTQTPAYSLDVLSGAQYSARFNSSAAQGGFVAWANSGTAYGYIGNAYHIVTGGSSGDMAMAATANMVFSTGGSLTERMRITSGGNVGIGTTAPSIKLSVAQDITNDGDIANGQFMVCGATTNLKRMVLGYDTNGEGYGYIESAYKDSAWTYTALQPTSGNVIIGSSAIPSYKLQVNGSAAKPGGGSWSDSSDARLKKDVKTIENALDKINKLNPVNFEWINPEEHHNQNNISGFIAQEIKEVFPDFINEVNPVGKDKDIVGENEKIYALTLSFKFDAYLVKAIQELSQQNKELNERLNKAGL